VDGRWTTSKSLANTKSENWMLNLIRVVCMLSRVKNRVLRALAVICVASSLASCLATARHSAVPPEDRRSATVMGITNARLYTDQTEEIEREQGKALIREAHYRGIKKGGTFPKTYGLTLSGGADDGAFGAGLLVGWSVHGDRPTFKLVTGVSTGALIAPFAFLGSKYDPVLTRIYTTLDKSKVYTERFAPVAAIAQDALADTDPLFKTISQFLDEQFLSEIAAEYEKGRLLVVQTTDLDAGRPVLWNIGAIAASGNPRALDLVRRILLASSAIPAAFPPVLFEVEANGQKYHELHVDGGAVSQSVLAPAKMDLNAVLKDTGYKHQGFGVYVIRNGHLHTEWSQTEQKTLTIAQRAVSVLTNYSGVGDLYKMYLISKRGGFDFNLAYIPDDFFPDHKTDFDPDYMNKLFHYSFEKAAKGYPWDHAPPGLNSKDD
jgi:predicted acylesterase/phospholipase RssA